MKNKTLRYTSLSVLTLLATLTLAACGGKTDKNTSASNQKETTSTEKVFYYAASHNLLVKNQFDPRQLGTLAFRFVRFAVNIVSIYYFLYLLLFPLKFGQPIGDESYGLWFAGILFFTIFLMYNQNNPVRFVKIMRLYSQGKVRFKEEVDN